MRPIVSLILSLSMLYVVLFWLPTDDYLTLGQKTKRICGPLPNRERETDQGFFLLLSVLYCVMFYFKFIIFQIVYNEEGDTTTH